MNLAPRRLQAESELLRCNSCQIELRHPPDTLFQLLFSSSLDLNELTESMITLRPALTSVPKAAATATATLHSACSLSRSWYCCLCLCMWTGTVTVPGRNNSVEGSLLTYVPSGGRLARFVRNLEPRFRQFVSIGTCGFFFRFFSSPSSRMLHRHPASSTCLLHSACVLESPGVVGL
jgi:hypothetical protein